MRNLTIVILVALAACKSPGGGNYLVTLDKPADVLLAHGQSVLVGEEPLRIAFRDVMEDSRCPSDVQCVWEGNGKVRLGLALGGAPETTADVNTSTPATRAYIGGYRISLIDLMPNPVSTSSIPPNTYRVRLLVELGPPPN